MKDGVLIFSSLKSRWLNSVLSVLLTAFGVTLAVLLIQFGHHVQNRLSADSQGIDIVVGAKGSPLQLVLSSVYHIDIPTGNIAYAEAKKWMKHPQIRTAIPLALGDNWHGYRIVGTTHDYITHYNAKIKDGDVWNKPFQAVIGADIPLKIGDTFVGAHGLSAGGHSHDDEKYSVTGVMARTGSVLDRLILTSMDSVLHLHGQSGVEYAHHHDDHDHHHDHDHHGHESNAEITALLLSAKTPVANMNLPRMINRETALQAANPALEIVRLTSLLGLGAQSFAILAAILIIVAGLSVFAGLAGSLEGRMGDLSVLRAVGYSKSRLFKMIVIEGMLIVTVGIILGLVMGLCGFMMIVEMVPPLAASGATVHFTHDIILLVSVVAVAGLAATSLPAIRAAKVDAARQLSRNV